MTASRVETRVGLAAVADTRAERKERTRRAILDAALQLCEDSSLVALSLRQVAKEVGVVPTAFYRHFDSIEALGLELVDESFESLRAMLRDVRRSDPALDGIIDSSVSILDDHVRRRRGHFAFIARERTAGPPTVRQAIRHELQLCERELAVDLQRLLGMEAWSADDLRVLSAMIVSSMVTTAENILGATGRAEATQATDQARQQLRMMIVGAMNWRSRP